MKKNRTWMVMILMLSLLVTACSGQTHQAKANDPSPDAAAGKPVKLRVMYMVFNVPNDISEVEAKLNQLLQDRIQATIELIPVQMTSYSQQMNLVMTSREDMDLVMTGYMGNVLTYSQQVAKGELLPLDDLLTTYGSGILDSLGDYARTAAVGGKVYGVTTNRDLAGSEGWVVRKDMLDKYKIDTASIQTLQDIEQALERIRGGESINPFGIGNGRTFVTGFYPDNIDSLGDNLGVIRNDDSAMKVINFYETEEYKSLVSQARAWFQKGLIPKDVATVTQSSETLMKSNKIISYIDTARPGSAERISGLVGMPVEVFPISKAKAETTTVSKFMWGIASHSKHPQQAMQLLNLMYSDKEVYNLLAWGIEGKHYMKVDDTFIKYPEGQNSTNSDYALNMEFAMGNMFLSYLWEGEDATLWEQLQDFNEQAYRSSALGFLWNGTPVKNEIAAVVNVRDQYAKALENGLVDPDKYLPEFIEKLKGAGIDKIIAEKQKQLDQWKALKEQ
ncbi:ABC transporter substrate-binding protein [Paenibacillus piscarius]|uniref:ABC transporter substrate-binding protein n=1 Tax=Paenibacillus piscarius TaxID=1089681 RepID=UPI001EE97D0A|nr:ABC transporter substrate-binding protein [Paenibacillus piscarius]